MIKKSLLALSLSALLAAPAYADLTINGFASIKAGMTLDSDDTLYGYVLYDDDGDLINPSQYIWVDMNCPVISRLPFAFRCHSA